MKRYVPPTGPHNASIMLVGEAPGAEEERNLIPFASTGQAGRILNRALAAAKINRDDCYITNIIRFRPPNNDFNRINPDELYMGTQTLKKEILEVNPNVIIALGGQAIKALTSKVGVMKWRGSVVPSTLVEGYKVMCVEHPAFILPSRRPEDFYLLVFDLERAKEQSEYKELKAYEKTMLIDPTFGEVMAYLGEARLVEDIVVDIETTYTTKKVICVGVSASQRRAMCIPFRIKDEHRWSDVEETNIWEMLQCLLTSTSIGKVNQNISFDSTILYPIIGEINPVSFDTMLAHHTLHIEHPHGLAYLTSIYTNHPYYKDDGKTWREKGDISKLWEYNCTDCIVTRDVASELRKELEEAGLEEFFYGYVMPLSRIMWRVERFGIKIDEKKRKGMAGVAQKQLESLQSQLDGIVGHPLNVNSSKQMKEFLYEELKYPIKRNRKTGKVTADQSAIQILSSKYPNRAFDLVLKIRGLTKSLGTYLNAGVDVDGRIRTSYLVSGTDTGRLSSRKSIYGSGMDLQNVPESLRTPFVADSGKTLIEFDLSQADNRSVAYLARDERQIKLLDTGGDYHAIMSGWLNIERSIAKKVVHGVNYGMKKRLLSELTGIPEYKAEQIRQLYFKECPAIEHWHKSVQLQLKKNRTLINPFGRKRVFYGLYGDDMFRKAYAFLGQSTTADWLNINLICAYHVLSDRIDILLQVYDSLLIQSNSELVSDVSNTIKKLLERKFKVNGRMLSIPCNVKIGNNWGEMEDYDG